MNLNWEQIAQHTVGLFSHLDENDLDDIRQEILLTLLENQQKILSMNSRAEAYAYGLAKKCVLRQLRELRQYRDHEITVDSEQSLTTQRRGMRLNIAKDLLA